MRPKNPRKNKLKAKKRVKAEPKGERIPSYENPYRKPKTNIKIRETIRNTRLLLNEEPKSYPKFNKKFTP